MDSDRGDLSIARQYGECCPFLMQTMRESLEKVLRKQMTAGAVSCYDLAHDLAGTVKGLPKDLPDNPKYLEDFGK